MSKFEAHITLHVAHAPAGRRAAEQFGWKTSEITGDPLLGPKPYFYLTRYDSDGQALLNEMKRVDADLRMHDAIPLRLKLEEVIYDTRTGLNAKGW